MLWANSAKNNIIGPTILQMFTSFIIGSCFKLVSTKFGRLRWSKRYAKYGGKDTIG